MKSIGELISQANADEMRKAEKPLDVVEEPRPHRVTLCVMTFAQSEVMATTAHEAMRLAESDPKHARRTFQTEPSAHRVEVLRRKEPNNPESPIRPTRTARSDSAASSRPHYTPQHPFFVTP
jgi:hypothetical protein